MLTIYSFIAQLLRSYGIWFLVYLEFVGSCQCLLLGFLLSGKGRFGRHCNGDIWKVVPPCGETNLFLLFWIYLTFVMFVFDLFTPVYSLCIWVPLSFWYQWIFITYQKKNKGQINLVWWLSTPLTNCWQIVVKVSFLYISFESKIVHSCFRSPSFLHYLMSKSSSNEIFFCFCTENCNVFLLLLIYFFYHLAPIKDSLLHKENSEQT